MSRRLVLSPLPVQMSTSGAENILNDRGAVGHSCTRLGHLAPVRNRGRMREGEDGLYSGALQVDRLFLNRTVRQWI